MKKNIKILFLVILVFAVLYGVLVIKSNQKFDKVDNTSMEIKEGTLTSTSATIIITDTSLEKYEYDNVFMIYKKKFGIWTAVTEKVKWVSSPGYYVDANGKLEMECNFPKQKLGKGLYRLSKWAYLKDGTVKNIYVEFEIK